MCTWHCSMFGRNRTTIVHVPKEEEEEGEEDNMHANSKQVPELTAPVSKA